MKRKIIFISVGIILAVLIIIFTLINYNNQGERFSKTILLKLSSSVGTDTSTSVKITNYKDTTEKFSLSFKNLENIVSIQDREFELNSKESREIDVLFFGDVKEIGVYSGQLIIETEDETQNIPIIFAVEDPDSALVIVQDGIPKYDNVYPGGKLGVDIRTFSVFGVNATTVKAKFLIKDFEDNILWADEGSLIIDGTKTEIIEVPKDWETGDYVFVTEVDYLGKKSAAGYLFSVGEIDNSKGIFSGDIKFFVGVILVFLIIILALLFYFVKSRDKVLVELKKQQNDEVKRNLNVIKNYERDVQKLKDANKRRERLEKLRQTKIKIVKTIKAKQKRQQKIIKRLKKKGKTSDVKKKIEQWKKQGYKMFETSREIRKFSNKPMAQQVNEWKRKGYDVSFMGK